MTRLYFEGSDFGVPTVSPAFDAAWGDTEDAVRRWLSTVPMASVMVSQSGDEAIATSPLDVLVAQFTSAPVSAQTISGTVKGQIRASESNADADFRAQVVAWVVKPDGTSRGTLLAADTSALSSEMTTTLTNRKYPLAAISPATLSSVVAVAGDRIVIEVGVRSHNTHTTNRSATLRFGTSATTDIAEDETTTADDRPWIELSGTITFEPVPLRATQTLVEVEITDATPEIRATQTFVEVAIARDYVFLDGVLVLDDEVPYFPEG